MFSIMLKFVGWLSRNDSFGFGSLLCNHPKTAFQSAMTSQVWSLRLKVSEKRHIFLDQKSFPVCIFTKIESKL